MNKVRGYIFSRLFMGERVPQHVQNLVIRDYCERNHLQFLLSATEYAMEDCHLIFEEVLGKLSEISGIVLYSLFQLPEDNVRRKANNTSSELGWGPNNNVKAYSSKPGQLSAKTQAQRDATKYKRLNKKQPVKTLSSLVCPIERIFFLRQLSKSKTAI